MLPQEQSLRLVELQDITIPVEDAHTLNGETHARDGDTLSDRVQQFGRELGQPWMAPALTDGAPLGRWALQLGWSCRGGLVVFAAMIYATLPQLEHANWQAFAVLCPAMSAGLLGMAPVRVCGALMLLSRHFLTGGLIAAFISMIAVESARPLAAPGERSQGRDLLCFALTVTGFAFMCSRPSLNIVQKKIGCALLAVGTHLPVRASFPASDAWGVTFPLKILVPVAIAAALCIGVCLLPLPSSVTATGSLRKRARFHVHLVRALLETILSLGLTYDAAALAHAEARSAPFEPRRAKQS